MIQPPRDTGISKRSAWAETVANRSLRNNRGQGRWRRCCHPDGLPTGGFTGELNGVTGDSPTAVGATELEVGKLEDDDDLSPLELPTPVRGCDPDLGPGCEESTKPPDLTEWSKAAVPTDLPRLVELADREDVEDERDADHRRRRCNVYR
ncbi:uncharacterized protein IUM83_10680 [Phytophthora cinnamomi]|uniref:uncharacterized protein n=1 Tax=Phytophthora cinnamomi TaxID=4785 RepID=UPI00355A87C1|nr:hypothetical protein IUM83_10680 [Phytophthora cinnamomi]